MLGLALLIALAQEPPVPTFGTTVYSNAGFTGEIYHIPEGSPRLPKFDRLEPKGSIYTNALNVPRRDFREGFPGITDRYEWFAIDYTGTFWFDRDALYRFSLTSDDGAKLYIDGHQTIDNDGIHPERIRTGRRQLKRGIHTLRVSYMQGPGLHVALVLKVAAPAEDFHVFSAADFRPPSGVDVQASQRHR
jgi:hypothetical protein